MTRPGAPLFNLRQPRHPALDGARGLAVVAMVLGHTLDALLSPEARQCDWVQRYWELRGVTAPLFLLVSGWALVAALGPAPQAAASSFGRRARRALLLLFLGYLLHWPGWEAAQALGWGPTLFSSFLAFDALQCIGVSLLVCAAVLVLARGAWTRTLALGALAISVPLTSTWMWHTGASLPEVLHNAVGNTGTRFPLFPYAGFFFAGALAAHLLRLLRPGWPQGLALVLLGAGLLGATHLLPADWSPTSVWLVSLRVGQGFLVLGAVSLLPQVLSGLLAPLGRTSLWLYVLHLPVVYGWASITGLAGHVGPTLDLPSALLVAIALLTACFCIAWLAGWLRHSTVTWRRPQTSPFTTSLGSGQRI